MAAVHETARGGGAPQEIDNNTNVTELSGIKIVHDVRNHVPSSFLPFP